MANASIPSVLSGDERFRLLVETVDDYAIILLTPEGVIASWNRGAERFLGYAEQDILGHHVGVLFPEQDRARHLPERALEHARQTGRFETEGWRLRQDGRRIWVHSSLKTITSEAGVLLGFAKITRDRTEQKRATDDLRLSEERFRLLVQGIHDYAIYMLDPHGYVTNWNSGAQRFKGYTAAEIVGQHFSRFYTEEDRATDLPGRALATARAQGRFEAEGWRVRKDGTRFWATVVIDAIRDDTGELVGFAKVTRDVTERREAQRALEEARAALVQSQKMETLGQLSGGVAHDFNNLLAVVLGNLDLLRKRLRREDPGLTLVENSIKAVQRGATLTRRMLAFARRQDLQVEAVEVPVLVHSMADLLSRSLGPNIHVEMLFPLNLPSVKADRQQLELSLLNLAVNSRDAMPKGGTLRIAARAAPVQALPPGLAPGGYVCLSLQDSGTGMDPQTLARAVEPFFTTKGVGKGTGLGLSMIHGFAEQSGGRLILHSTEGQGTTAELWLPVATASVGPAPRAEAPAPLETMPRKRVLVVDDDELVLANIAAMLEDLGHDVREASSAEQAIRVLRRDPSLDVVLTDHLMPGMTGLELIQWAFRERPDMPMILASGFAELPSSDLAFVRLNKPFDQRALAHALREAIARSGKVVRLPRQR